MASSFTKLMGPSTAPVAAATPGVTSSGVNPSTGATYSKILPTPAPGTAPSGGSTLAPYTPTTVVPADPTNPNSGTYAPGHYSNEGSDTYNDYDGSIYAGNGTYGALGTNAPTSGIGNVSGGAPSGTTGGTAPVSGSADSAAASAAAAARPTYGTESGPGLLDQWFNERATGTDPGWEYATKRAGTALDNAYAARGGYNGGAAMQGQGDMLAGAISGREGQLDSLAGGSSGERANSLATMLGLGTGLAGGEAGLGFGYDSGAASAMSGANNNGLQLGMGGVMLPYSANQNFLQSLFGL